jgi:hypothetical protein
MYGIDVIGPVNPIALQSEPQREPTLFSLVYGMVAVMPLEVEISSLRILIDSELEEVKWANVKYEQLNLINEKMIAAIFHHQLY